MNNSTPVYSPERQITSSSRTAKQGSLTSSDTTTPLFLVYEENPLFEGMNRGYYIPIDNQIHFDDPVMSLNSQKQRLATNCNSAFWIPENRIVDDSKL